MRSQIGEAVRLLGEGPVNEKLREERIRTRGWGLDRVVWSELSYPAQLADRIHEAVKTPQVRLGTQLRTQPTT